MTNTFKIIPYLDEEAWKRSRLLGVSSSEAASLLGKSPWMSREDLYLVKIGRHTPEFDSKTRARFMAGHDIEPALAAKAYMDYGYLFPGRVLHDPCQAIQARQFGGDEPFWLTCTVDRLLVPELHGLFDPHLAASAYPTFHIMELKTSSGMRGNELPEQYLYQVQQQLLVTGCPRAYLVSMAIEDTSRWDRISKSQALVNFANASVHHWIIEPDESIHQEILREAERLCREVNSYRESQGLQPRSVEK